EPAAATPERGAPVVVVADDSVVSRMLEKGVLEAAGYQVRAAADGVEAWEMLAEGGCSLLVSDVNMPRLDGLQLTARLRAEPRLPGDHAPLPRLGRGQGARRRGGSRRVHRQDRVDRGRPARSRARADRGAMPRVLVVDDSPASRRLLTHILHRDPAITVAGEAPNGAEAVRMTARLSPDIVTMDVQMPVMDGFEA